MITTILVGSCRYALSALFLLAAAHKAIELSRDRAEEAPLIAWSRPRARHASALLGAAAITEVAAAALLTVRPTIGLPLAASLLLFYAVDLRHIAPHEDCDCFGTLAPTDRASGQRRNVLLATAAAFCTVLLATGHASSRMIDARAMSMALVVLAPLAARLVLSAIGSGSTFSRGGARVGSE
jgi:hypothetical protein